MNHRFRLPLLFAALFAAMGAAPSPPSSPEEAVKDWPVRAKTTARAMLEKYGPPDQYDRRSLVWFNKGTWKRTIVHREGCPGRRAGRSASRGHLEQTIGYMVPTARVRELRRFDPRLEVAERPGELTYCSDNERKNSLAINVADEVVTGQRTASDARSFYDRASRLAASGKSSSLTEGLVFEVDNTSAGDTAVGADR